MTLENQGPSNFSETSLFQAVNGASESSQDSVKPSVNGPKSFAETQLAQAMGSTEDAEQIQGPASFAETQFAQAMRPTEGNGESQAEPIDMRAEMITNATSLVSEVAQLRPGANESAQDFKLRVLKLLDANAHALISKFPKAPTESGKLFN